MLRRPSGMRDHGPFVTARSSIESKIRAGRGALAERPAVLLRCQCEGKPRCTLEQTRLTGRNSPAPRELRAARQTSCGTHRPSSASESGSGEAVLAKRADAGAAADVQRAAVRRASARDAVAEGAQEGRREAAAAARSPEGSRSCASSDGRTAPGRGWRCPSRRSGTAGAAAARRSGRAPRDTATRQPVGGRVLGRTARRLGARNAARGQRNRPDRGLDGGRAGGVLRGAGREGGDRPRGAGKARGPGR